MTGPPSWSAPPAYAKPVFLICTTLFWSSHYTYVPILSPYAEHLGGSFRLIGLIVSAYGCALLCLRLPLGMLSDRIGRRKPFVTVALFLSAVSGAGLALAPSPEAMVLARLLSGVSACAWVAFTVLFASYYPPGQTTRPMGHITFCNGFSIMAATFLGGWLAIPSTGWLPSGQPEASDWLDASCLSSSWRPGGNRSGCPI